MRVIHLITSDELNAAIRRSRALSSPSPLDQIPYRIFKGCPSLQPVILDLFYEMLVSGEVPSGWKGGIFKLVAKSSVREDPHQSGTFRPIALMPGLSKLLSAMLKDRWLRLMSINGCLDSEVQKAFLPLVSGLSEQQCKLAAIARSSKHSLGVAWLDIANACGSVHHSLIQFAMPCYHAPPQLCTLLHSWYSGLSATVSTTEWMSHAIPLEIGVYQGSPMSVVIFLTVSPHCSMPSKIWG